MLVILCPDMRVIKVMESLFAAFTLPGIMHHFIESGSFTAPPAVSGLAVMMITECPSAAPGAV